MLQGLLNPAAFLTGVGRLPAYHSSNPMALKLESSPPFRETLL